MNKTIRERVEAYKLYEPENILLAMAETEELMVQISRATTLAQAQELSRAWLLVFNSDQVPPVVVPEASAALGGLKCAYCGSHIDNAEHWRKHMEEMHSNLKVEGY